MNINDLFQNAAAAADQETTDFPDDLTHEELPEGTVVLCEIVYAQAKMRPAKADKNKGEAITFNQKLKVLEGPHADGVFWDPIYLSGGDLSGVINDNQASYNKRLFAKLAAAGIDGTFLSTNPSNEAIAKALVGSKVRVTVKWQKPSADGRRFLDNTTTWDAPDGGGGGGYVPGATKGF